MPKLIDMTGKRFHRLLVEKVEGREGTVPLWRCLCDCGTVVHASGSALRLGRYCSCGCLKAERSAEAYTTHGLSGQVERTIWQAMKQRCANPNNAAYPRYGGRGIRVCDRWKNSFANFFLDMGPRPSPSHSIDRADNNGDYEPSNCRWATSTQQNSNTRRNVLVVHDGERVTLSEWARRHGMPVMKAWRLLERGLVPRQ